MTSGAVRPTGLRGLRWLGAGGAGCGYERGVRTGSDGMEAESAM